MKNVWMIIVSSCILLSCDLHGDRIKRKYILENGTERNIQIDFYEDSHYKASNFISGPGKIVEGISDDLGMGRSLSPIFYGFSDSIVVIYDNKKIQIYYLNNGLQSLPVVEKNILDNESYTVENNELYRYVFSETDYENAEVL